MTCLRHRTWYLRIAIFAMAALLWSQFALSGHADCLATTSPSVPAEVSLNDHGCDGGIASSDEAMCDAHCSEDDVSADSGRVPLLPPLFAGSWWSGVSVAELTAAEAAAGAPSIHSPPRVVWNRPTAHPAALLLI